MKHKRQFCNAIFAFVASLSCVSGVLAEGPNPPASQASDLETASQAEPTANSASEVSSTAQATTTVAVPVQTSDSKKRSLIPEGEEEKMGKHPVDGAHVHFKPGKGLIITSADKQFSLKTRVRIQLLYDLESEHGADPKQNFRMRRVRFIFSGNAFGKKNKYKFEIDALQHTSAPVLDYYLEFGKNRDLTVRIGQYKISSNRQRVISSGNLQFVDRTIINAEFTLDRDMGLDLRSKNFLGLDKLKYVVGVYLGGGPDNPGARGFGMLYLVRLEYLPFGMFQDYSEVDFSRARKPRLSLGFGYAFQDNARRQRRTGTNISSGATRPSDGGTSDYHYGYFDSIFKYAGFSFQTEVALRKGTRNPGTAGPVEAARNGWGWTLQGGYLIPRMPLEVAARVSCLHSIGSNTSLSDKKEAGGGLSWYFGHHAFKLQADVFQIWGNKISEGDTQLRIQLQASI